MVNWALFADRVEEHVGIRTSISCPFSCAFCGFPRHAGKYQTAAVDKIKAELDGLAQIKSITGVNFIDDTFNVPAKRFKEILRMMIKNKYQFQWNSHFRCQFADKEMVELMKESGCEGVFLGIESGNDEILKNMNKVASADKYFKGISLLKEYEILTFGSFIIGFPGETAETVRDTSRFIEKSGLDFYRAQPWYCDTITPIWEQKEEYRIKGSQFEWSHHTMSAQQACDLIDRAFLTIEKPLWVPQYNFEFEAIFHLLHRGITLEQVKRFISAFNSGIKEKLPNPSREEISFDVLKKLKASCRKSGEPDKELEEINHSDKLTADFDF
ncbi:radical SAM protein, partial [Acidobacteriota bacterium]